MMSTIPPRMMTIIGIALHRISPVLTHSSFFPKNFNMFIQVYPPIPPPIVKKKTSNVTGSPSCSGPNIPKDPNIESRRSAKKISIPSPTIIASNVGRVGARKTSCRSVRHLWIVFWFVSFKCQTGQLVDVLSKYGIYKTSKLTKTLLVATADTTPKETWILYSKIHEK